jgi:hypothetical protein
MKCGADRTVSLLKPPPSLVKVQSQETNVEASTGVTLFAVEGEAKGEIWAAYPKWRYEVGTMQGKFPLSKNESFVITIQALGTFGAIGMVLHLRSLQKP